MDEAAFGAVERAIRGSMTAEQCVRIERLARETVASRALEALIGEKVVDLAASRRCPHCGTVDIVKHGRDENGQQRFRCRSPLGCGRTFNALTNTPLHQCASPRSGWPMPRHSASGGHSTGFMSIWASRA